jgi:hypothetical protein
MACSGWICRRYITKITGAYGRWKIKYLYRTSSTREKVVYLVKYRFFKGFGTLWEAIKPPPPPTPHKSTHSNLMCGIFGDWCFVSRKSVPDFRKSPNSQFSPKLKVEKLTRTYAVNRRIFPSFQVICPT